METTARFDRIGMAEGIFAFRGNKVLCDKLVRVRRFRTEAAALRAGMKANDAQFR